MISQNSNNKPTNTQAKVCDSGIPISGRTGTTGQYQILKVTNDGTLVASNGTIASGTYLQFATPINCATGALAANTLIAKTQFTFSEGGLYRINPAFIFNGATTGGINFVIYNNFGAMNTYINTLNDGDPFSPTLAEVAPNGGVAGYIHNSAVQSFGTGIEISYNRNNTLDIYMDIGNYWIAIISDGLVNITSPTAVFGMIELTKLS
jgi:hypothetical protein